ERLHVDLRILRDDLAGNRIQRERVIGDAADQRTPLGVGGAAHRSAGAYVGARIDAAKVRVNDRRIPGDPQRIDAGVGDDLEAESLLAGDREVERNRLDGVVGRAQVHREGDGQNRVVAVALDDLDGYVVGGGLLVNRAADPDAAGRGRHPGHRGPA